MGDITSCGWDPGLCGEREHASIEFCVLIGYGTVLCCKLLTFKFPYRDKLNRESEQAFSPLGCFCERIVSQQQERPQDTTSELLLSLRVCLEQ